MKTIRILCLVALTLMFIHPEPGAAQFVRGQGSRVCVYEHSNYQGWEECFAAGDEVSSLRGHRNQVSSIRVYGRARVTVYEDSAFSGTEEAFSADVPDLDRRNMYGSRSWNDRIDSLRVDDGFSGRGIGRGQQRDSDDGICVYEHANYRGRSECWNVGDQVGDLARVNSWNDKISSVRVFGRAAVVFHHDSGYRGYELLVDRDTPDLARIGMDGYANWNDQISSLEVERERGRFRTRR